MGVIDEVESVAKGAGAAARAVATCEERVLDETLVSIALLLEKESSAILEVNRAEVENARDRAPGFVERLRLTEKRIAAMASSVRALAALPPIERIAQKRVLENGLRIEERRVPVGVIGAIYEARANVTLDIATQLLKSRNCGVLRTGSAGANTSEALITKVVAPALTEAGLDAGAIGLIRGGHEAAEALVSLPHLVPLVIIRGSGETTRRLASLAASNGVRTLAHADGGGVMFVHRSAERDVALSLIEWSLDSLAVCNRLNLLLIDDGIWEKFLPMVIEKLGAMGIKASLPPHDHPLGYEWAIDEEQQNTVTVSMAEDPSAAAAIASGETPAIAASIVASDEAAASEFLESFRGTGVFWNASTRWLDGFRLTGAPETGINVDHVPGPRGPVTYRDLYLRQYAVIGDGTQRHS